MDGGVVEFDVVGFHQLIDFSASPDEGTIAVSSEVVDRAIGIEGRVERKSSTYTSAFHLPLGVHMGVDVVPGKNGLCAIVLCIEPSLVDGVGEAVAINGCAGSL